MTALTTAAIHHRNAPTAARPGSVIAVAVDGELTGVRRIEDAPGYPLKFHLADAFRSLWERYGETGLILYVSDPTVRRLLAEAGHENLYVRPVATGRLEETVRVASAAVAAALKGWGGRADEIDLLTDSTMVVHVLNQENPPTHYGGHQAAAIRMLERVREDAEVRIHWVRGHDGHLLNEIADRAALTTRRCTEFRTDNVEDFFETFREELARGLEGIDPDELIPGGCRYARVA